MGGTRKYNDFDDAAKERYLEALAELGMYIPAADSLGLKYADIRLYRKDNPEYQEACYESIERYRVKFVREAEERAIKGFERPIIGGRERNEVVAMERVVSDSLLGMFLKRGGTEERFTDKQEVAISGTVDLRKEFRFDTLSKEARKLLRAYLVQVKADNDAREAKQLTAGSPPTLGEGDPAE